MKDGKFGRPREVFGKRNPFHQPLGPKPPESAEGEASIRFGARPEFNGDFNLGVLHGGVISAALDVAGAGAVRSHFMDEGPQAGIGTVEPRVGCLRPPGGGHFIRAGKVMRPGRIPTLHPNGTGLRRGRTGRHCHRIATGPLPPHGPKPRLAAPSH